MPEDSGPIVLVSHSREVGGAELHLERLAAFMVRHQQHLALVCRNDAALNGWLDRMAALGVSVHRIDLNGPLSLLRLWRLLRRGRLVHLHLAHPVGKYQLLAAMLARWSRRPTLVTHHLALDVRAIGLGRAQGRIWLWLVRRWARGIDRHIAVSAYAKEVLQRVYRLPGDRIAVIYVGTDTTRFRPAGAPERAGLRRQLWQEIDSGAPPPGLEIVCTVARLSPQKGLVDLVEAARRLRGSHPSMRIVVIGGGPLRDDLARQLDRLDLAGIVHLAGNRPTGEVAHWLQATDVFVLPSHYEGGPATALTEAMSAGCAVVATRVSGSDELIVSGEVGVLVEARNPERLALAIAALLDDPARRARLGEQARSRVVHGFDMAQSHAQTLEVYRALLG